MYLVVGTCFTYGNKIYGQMTINNISYSYYTTLILNIQIIVWESVNNKLSWTFVVIDDIIRAESSVYF